MVPTVRLRAFVRYGPEVQGYAPVRGEPGRASRRLPRRLAGSRFRARAGTIEEPRLSGRPGPGSLPGRCSTRRCAKSGTAGRWASSTSPRSTTPPRSPSRSSTGSRAGCHRAERDGRLAVVTGTPGEQHALGARMVADFLEADGWEVMLLGAGAPAADVVALVEHEQPDLVALSTATAGVLDGVAEILAALAALRPAAVHRRGRPVLDRDHALHRVRARRRPRRAGPARARRRALHPGSATGLNGVGPSVGVTERTWTSVRLFHAYLIV